MLNISVAVPDVPDVRRATENEREERDETMMSDERQRVLSPNTTVLRSLHLHPGIIPTFMVSLRRHPWAASTGPSRILSSRRNRRPRSSSPPPHHPSDGDRGHTNVRPVRARPRRHPSPSRGGGHLATHPRVERPRKGRGRVRGAALVRGIISVRRVRVCGVSRMVYMRRTRVQRRRMDGGGS